MRRIVAIGCLLALIAAPLVGCSRAFVPAGAEDQALPDLGSQPAHEALGCPAPNQPPQAPPPPRSVLRPAGNPRPISLLECVALAVENGRVGNESVRALAFDPAIVGADIEQSLAKFDAHFQTNLSWNVVDQPPGIPQFTGMGSGVNQPNGTAAQLDTRLIKPLPTGGVAGITFRTDYSNSNGNPLPNTYQPVVTFSLEQPLLQGYGVEINQVRSSHPGSTLNPFDTGNSAPGILLARVAFDQARVDFERHMQDLVLAVEEAYWQLYGSYWALFAQETALRETYESWRTAQVRHAANQLSDQDLAEIEEQYHLLRASRLVALGQGLGRPGVLEAERQLRLVIGLPAEDGDQLVPTDTPTVAAYEPDYQAACRDALALRPELVRARADVKLAELTLRREEDLLLPDLRAFASYDVNGLGTRLDGAGPENALRTLASDHYNDWTIGLHLEVPLGFRAANAQVRKALLQVKRQRTVLLDLEEQALFSLQRSYRQLLQAQEQIHVLRARRLAALRQLRGRQEEFRSGLGSVDLLLRAQLAWTNSLQEEQTATCDYNSALASFERERGTLLTHDHIVIQEGALPSCALERAVEHFRQRDNAHILRERAHPSSVSTCEGGACERVTSPSPDHPPVLPLVLSDPTSSPLLPEVLPRKVEPAPAAPAPPPILPVSAPVASPDPAASAPKTTEPPTEPRQVVTAKEAHPPEPLNLPPLPPTTEPTIPSLPPVVPERTNEDLRPAVPAEPVQETAGEQRPTPVSEHSQTDWSDAVWFLIPIFLLLFAGAYVMIQLRSIFFRK